MIHACLSFLFFNDTATTEIYTLSLHDALPICRDELLERVRHGPRRLPAVLGLTVWVFVRGVLRGGGSRRRRSEEHTSELQSHSDLVCRLLLEKKKKKNIREKRIVVVSVSTYER